MHRNIKGYLHKLPFKSNATNVTLIEAMEYNAAKLIFLVLERELGLCVTIHCKVCKSNFEYNKILEFEFSLKDHSNQLIIWETVGKDIK